MDINAEKRLKRRIRLLKIGLILSTVLLVYGAAGATYTLMSNHSHASFSFDLGKPVLTTIMPGSTNSTTVSFTVRALNTGASSIANLFVNVTLDEHPDGTFTLNGLVPNGGDTQWIVDGPFTLGSNQAMLFSFTLNYGGSFGYYDIDATVVQQ